MRITEKDTEYPGFWAMRAEARKSVLAAMGLDETAPAHAEVWQAASAATDALTKAMIFRHRRMVGNPEVAA
jgi:hypothetical protein